MSSDDRRMTDNTVNGHFQGQPPLFAPSDFGSEADERSMGMLAAQNQPYVSRVSVRLYHDVELLCIGAAQEGLACFVCVLMGLRQCSHSSQGIWDDLSEHRAFFTPPQHELLLQDSAGTFETVSCVK